MNILCMAASREANGHPAPVAISLDTSEVSAIRDAGPKGTEEIKAVTMGRIFIKETSMSLAMSVTERETFLSGLHVGIISIPRATKGPLTVPIWYDYRPGGEVWVLTDSDSIKGKLLAKSTRISLCAQTETAPYQYVSVEGPFTTRPSTPEELLAMAIRYLGEKQGRAYAAGSGDGEGSITVSFRPETWYTVDYAKM